MVQCSMADVLTLEDINRAVEAMESAKIQGPYKIYVNSKSPMAKFIGTIQCAALVCDEREFVGFAR